MRAPVPHKNRLAQPCTRRNQPAVADCCRLPLAQHINLLRMQLRNPIAIGFKIIDKKQVLNIEVFGEFAAVENPRQIGELQPSLADWSRHAETCCRYFRLAAFFKEPAHDHFQPCIFLRRKLLVPDVRQFTFFKSIQRQVDFCSSHVSGQNHRSISSLPRPSAPGAGSCAAASLSKSSSSLPLFGRINCDGNVSGSYGPCNTRCSGSALSLPPIRKKTSLASISTGHVSVMRHVSFCGTWFATTMRPSSWMACVCGNSDAVCPSSPMPSWTPSNRGTSAPSSRKLLRISDSYRAAASSGSSSPSMRKTCSGLSGTFSSSDSRVMR